jgi:5S rRNA maturation endonuclease (ribonuclease M5)
MLAGSQVEKSSKITKRLMYNGIVEDPDKIGDKIRTLMKEKLLGNENLKQYLSE